MTTVRQAALALVRAAAAGVGAQLALRGARALPAEMTAPWRRANYLGRPVTLLEGPAWSAGALVGSGPSGGAIAALVGPTVVGAVDDLRGDSRTKGLRGHLTALARGHVTTGSAKIAGIGASALIAVVLDSRDRPRPAGLLLVDGLLVAASANLVNLLDLRPGRALKVVTAAGGLLLPDLRDAPREPGNPAAAAAVGASVALLPVDLRAEGMLGDSGANAAGALLGLAATRSLPAPGRLAALAVVVGLTLLSERVSFSAVIDRTPALRAIDRWGRQGPPAEGTA